MGQCDNGEMTWLILSLVAPGPYLLIAFVWLGYLLITFDGKPTAKRLALLAGPAALFLIGLLLVIIELQAR